MRDGDLTVARPCNRWGRDSATKMGRQYGACGQPPQFSRTDINFQRVPTADTSNPFIAADIPTPDESIVVIRFQDPKKFDTDLPYLLSMLLIPSCRAATTSRSLAARWASL
jgi:hypothetical protein